MDIEIDKYEELAQKYKELQHKYIGEIEEHSETLEDLASAKQMIKGLQMTITHLEDALTVDTEKESKINDLSDSDSEEDEEPKESPLKEAMDKFIVPLIPIAGKLLETYLEKMQNDLAPKEETENDKDFKEFLEGILERKEKENKDVEPCDNCGRHHGSLMLIHNKKLGATIFYDKNNDKTFEFKEKESDATRDIAFCKAGHCCDPGLFIILRHMNTHPNIMNNEAMASKLIEDIIEFAKSGRHLPDCKKSNEEVIPECRDVTNPDN